MSRISSINRNTYTDNTTRPSTPKSAKASTGKGKSKEQKPVTTTPAAKFTTRDVLQSLGVLAERAFKLIAENTKVSTDKDVEKQDEKKESRKKQGTTEAILTGILGLAAKNFPETTATVLDYVKKAGSALGIRSAEALTHTTSATAATNMTAASSGLSSSLAKTGFSSIEEMLGNGLYTPAPGSMMMTPANAGASATTATTSTVGTLTSAASGLAGVYSMIEGGTLVAEANKVGGLRGRKAGSIGGLTAGLGAGMALNALGIALGPVGWGALLVGTLAAGGLFGSRLGDKDRWKTEGKRLGKLIEKGINIPEELQGAMQLTRGRSKEELVNPNFPRDFVGQTEQGFVNNKFALSRDEKDLHPEDIWGYAAFFEKFGNDWLGKFSEDQRRDIAQAALDSGAVREKHGTMNITWSAELEEKIKSVTEAPRKDKK
jgi:hypothetical protein